MKWMNSKFNSNNKKAKFKIYRKKFYTLVVLYNHWTKTTILKRNIEIASSFLQEKSGQHRFGTEDPDIGKLFWTYWISRKKRWVWCCYICVGSDQEIRSDFEQK